jgi:SAM-dependent methyltransferase
MDQNELLSEQYADSSNLSIRGRFNSTFSVRDENPVSWTFDHFDLPTDARILDLGSGTGTIWSLNDAHIPQKWSIFLTDFSVGMITDARERLAPHQQSYAVADAQHLPCVADSFDAVVAMQMLYHVPDRKQAYQEIKRVLAQEGRLYATATSRENKQPLYEMMDEVSDAAITHPAKATDTDFNIESAGAELNEYFSNVTFHLFENELAVTDADLLVAWALSTTGFDGTSGFTEEDASELLELAERKLAKGPIRVQNNHGLFVAEI